MHQEPVFPLFQLILNLQWRFLVVKDLKQVAVAILKMLRN